MDDVARVRGAERGEHGERDGHGLVRRERAVAAQPLLERLAAHVLHGDVGGAVRGAAVVHPDDAGMIEAGRGPRLDAEALEELVVGGQPRLEHLDGDHAAEALVLGQIDVRHPSAPERRDDPVPAREQGRHRGGFSVAFVIVHRVMGPWGRDRRRRRETDVGDARARRSVRCSSLEDGAPAVARGAGAASLPGPRLSSARLPLDQQLQRLELVLLEPGEVAECGSSRPPRRTRSCSGGASSSPCTSGTRMRDTPARPRASTAARRRRSPPDVEQVGQPPLLLGEGRLPPRQQLADLAAS